MSNSIEERKAQDYKRLQESRDKVLACLLNEEKAMSTPAFDGSVEVEILTGESATCKLYDLSDVVKQEIIEMSLVIAVQLPSQKEEVDDETKPLKAYFLDDDLPKLYNILEEAAQKGIIQEWCLRFSYDTT